MRYVLLAYANAKQLDAMSASERAALGDECVANDEALRESGYLLSVQGLQSSRSAATVRIQCGKVSITNGPVAELNEQLIEIFTISARDLNEAIRVASMMPQARGGPIEVWPVLEPDSPDYASTNH